jgi:hypothetical protein
MVIRFFKQKQYKACLLKKCAFKKKYFWWR